MPARPLFKGTGLLYSFKPLAGRAGGEHEGAPQISMVRPWCSDEQNRNGKISIIFIDCSAIGKKRPVKDIESLLKKVSQKGRRPDLTGGGLLRSFGGWTALKGFRNAGIRVKGDEQILGDSDFVEKVLKSAEEAFEEKYELKARGYDFDWAICRVAEVLDMLPAQVTAFGKSPQTLKARSLLCFWAHRRLGMSTIEVARKLRINQPMVSRSSKRGELIENEHGFELIPQKS